MPYNMPPPHKRCADTFVSFSETTSFHGIPHIGAAKTNKSRSFWTFVLLLSLSIFIYQLVLTVQRYFRYDKIMEIRINFEHIDFPAVTFCNLNPYKKTAVKDNPKLQQMMDIYEVAATGKKAEEEKGRQKRGTRIYELSHAWCLCGDQLLPDNSCKVAKDEDAEAIEYNTTELISDTKPLFAFIDEIFANDTMCICSTNQISGQKYPCYPRRKWSETYCSKCSSTGICNFPQEDLSKKTRKHPCVCTTVSQLCVLKPGYIIEEHWDVEFNAKPPKKQRDILHEFGYDKVEDKSAIQSKAKENLRFLVSEEPLETRTNLSYSKEETVLSCSFGGSDCNLTRDFALSADPSFGNCYTFNHDGHFKAARPGALYGLRLMLFSSKEEYLPTTESMGVKISVHHQTEYPFPDTYGYNAPVGFLSSFAVQAQKIVSLPAPYGDCIDMTKFDFQARGYLYGTKYSIEGCQRSCLQNQNIAACGCADAKIPIPDGWSPCAAGSLSARQCLDLVAKRSIKNPMSCKCGQPCSKTNYHCSFSSAIWPSESSRSTLCPETNPKCIEEYREQAAFIEVYFQQVNYQLLKEHEAYNWVNLMSDFGGQISLFLGVSVITIIEVIVLLVRLCACVCCTSRKGDNVHESAKLPRDITFQSECFSQSIGGTLFLED